ncbi:MAG TPA: hypothetical protein VMG39_15690 [Pseudolabrys sp.]|nr:hypothetical protein [Pseudolabrys sp.]
MSKLLKFFAIAALVGGAFAMTPGPAAAQHHHGGGGGHWHGGGGWHGGGWRGGGWGGFGPGFVFGFGPGWGWDYPYGYYPGPYFAGPDCGWVRVRVWRHGHWIIRRAWRCW